MIQQHDTFLYFKTSLKFKHYYAALHLDVLWSNSYECIDQQRYGESMYIVGIYLYL